MEHQKTRTEHGANVIAHEAKEEDIAALAYELWQGRCCPEGSPEEDWFHAVEELRSRH
jgi:nucleoside phosphorylase